MPLLHAYEVQSKRDNGHVLKPVKLEPTTIAADGDAARKAAVSYLESQGYEIRSLNWGPDPSRHTGKEMALIAYVMKKESA